MACDGPTIDLWYGDALPAGLGHPQRWVSILGNVSDPDGVSSFESSLDGSPFVARPLGRDALRLQSRGDFNVGIDRTGLADGTHTVELRAEDGAGGVCTRTVTFEHDGSAEWPLPFSARFDALSSATSIPTVAQPVDGRWEVTSSGLRIVEPGYDRLVAVGDTDWRPPYQARASVTIHGFGEWGGIGVAAGWRGHEGMDEPPTDWPVGGLAWVRNKTSGQELEITTFDEGTVQTRPYMLEAGETYVFRVAADPAGGTRMRVHAKVWNAADPEPAGWLLSADVRHRTGSVLLVAHAAEVTWHDFEATPTVAPADAGVPHGMSDAGTPDAGTPDAATPDAGTPDAGTPDAGTPDAGTPDAGTPDAGTPDAGEPDAATDAGTPDAGGRDGGPLDAGRSLDAAVARDVGHAPDASLPSDAEPSPDAGADAGRKKKRLSGCAAAGGTPSSAAWLLPLLFAALARRRR